MTGDPVSISVNANGVGESNRPGYTHTPWVPADQLRGKGSGVFHPALIHDHMSSHFTIRVAARPCTYSE